MPEKLPLPAPQATTVSKPKPATGNFSPYSEYCLMKVRDLIAGEVRHHEVGLRLPDFQEIGAEVGGVGRDELIGRELTAVRLHEFLGDAQKVVTEGVVCRQRVPFLSLHHVLAQQVLPDRHHVHRVRALDVEHVWIAARAAQRIGIAAGVDEHRLHPVRHLTDRKAGGRRNLADDHRDLVALDQALGLGGGRLRIDRVLHHELDFAAHNAAGRIDLFRRELDAHDGIFAERSQEIRSAA